MGTGIDNPGNQQFAWSRPSNISRSQHVMWMKEVTLPWEARKALHPSDVRRSHVERANDWITRLFILTCRCFWEIISFANKLLFSRMAGNWKSSKTRELLSIREFYGSWHQSVALLPSVGLSLGPFIPALLCHVWMGARRETNNVPERSCMCE